MFWRTNNICECTFYPFYTSKEAGNARRIRNGTWLDWVLSSVRTVNGCRCVACVSTVATGYSPFASGMAACLCHQGLFLTLKYEEQQSGTGSLLSLVVSGGILCVVIDSRDGIRWAGVMCQAVNPNHLTFKNWASPPAPCPITHMFCQRENSGSRSRILLNRDVIRVMWLMSDWCPFM